VGILKYGVTKAPGNGKRRNKQKKLSVLSDLCERLKSKISNE